MMQVSNVQKDIISLGIIATLVASLAVFLHIFGPIIGHSFTPNYTWVQAFTSQLQQGEIYPRWLYQNYQGAGSPPFYFYGPMPFWVSAIAALVFCPACSPEASFMIGPSVLLGLASISCYYFIKNIADRKIALLSSLLYFFLPCHFIINFWIRNTWGELSAYVFMPLLLLAINKSAKEIKYPVAPAVAYAGLLFSHLPSALLFSPVMLFYACLEFGWLKCLPKVVFIVLMGMGLAAIYIFPALTTQNLINHEHWANFNPVDWLWFSGKYSISRGEIFLIVVVYSLLFIWINIRLFTTKKIMQEKLLMTAIIAAVYSVFLMTDLSLPLWEHVGLLQKVQFPWRVACVLDLSIVIIFALFLKRIKKYQYKYLLYISIVFLYVLGSFIYFSQQLPVFLLTYKDEAIDELVLSGFEPAEYRTEWLAQNYPNLSYRELESVLSRIPTASIIQGVGSIIELQEFGDKLILQINATTNVRIRLRRFYYPGWSLMKSDHLDEKLPVELSPYYALVESSLPAGNYSVTLTRRYLPEVYLGGAVSIICLLCCGFIIYQANRHPVNLAKYRA